MGLFSKLPPTKSLFASITEKTDAAYIEILKRSDDPQEGDAERLAELLPFLNITLKDAQKDFAVLKRAAELEQILADAAAAGEVIKRLEPKRNELRQQLTDYQAKMQPKIADLDMTLMQQGEIEHRRYQAKADLDKLRQGFPRAFGAKPETN